MGTMVNLGLKGFTRHLFLAVMIFFNDFGGGVMRLFISTFDNCNPNLKIKCRVYKTVSFLYSFSFASEIVLPGTNTSTPSGGSSNKISAGQKILVIKTPKGVYIRTNDGKMFAVRSKSGAGLGNVMAGASTGGAASTTTTTTLTSADGNRGMYHYSAPYGVPPFP